MYQVIDNRVTLSVNDWLDAGLSYTLFKNDSKRGYLKIFKRGVNGETLIDVETILKSDRLAAIEAVYGKASEMREPSKRIHTVELDSEARAYYSGLDILADKVREYTAKASMFNAMREGRRDRKMARAVNGKRLTNKEYFGAMVQWWNDRAESYGVAPYTNARSLERAFKEYCNGGYPALVHKGYGSENARVVSAKMQNLWLSLWRTYDKPFIHRVWELYNEFISGRTELFDRETGEVYRPADFIEEGKACEISEATMWRYLKDVVNNTAVYADRNGNFEYTNKLRPKHNRNNGVYALSKVSMDDVALSRKSKRGWIYKYIAVDVVSGYYFRPAYIVGKPNHNTVIEAFRNMFCELQEMGLPMPGELEVEYHLMKDFDWLNEMFPFVRFCNSPTEKRVEHTNRSFKYSISKRNGHTRGRWYGRGEAYKATRYKESGDFVEPEYEVERIIADDLADVEEYNNTLHPRQKTFKGLTRREVLLQHRNPKLKPLANTFLCRYIGNITNTSLRNNDYCVVNYEEFQLRDFSSLEKLKPNCTKVTAYWLPDSEGAVEDVYLYQDETFIGIAENRSKYAYNECAIERDETDEANLLYQHKRVAKYDKYIRDRREQLMKVGRLIADNGKLITDSGQLTEDSVEVLDVKIGEQPKGYESDDESYSAIDIAEWTKKAIKRM